MFDTDRAARAVTGATAASAAPSHARCTRRAPRSWSRAGRRREVLDALAAEFGGAGERRRGRPRHNGDGRALIAAAEARALGHSRSSV